MAKAAERKIEKRKRQKELGVTKIELFLGEQGLEILPRNCVICRSGREQYNVANYLFM
ncbi:hypothetical protein [Providencia stuartii]|uniref:hypothetical protein n=1 Tax=Providencia stuartii TaxID=588 RepID=UPI003D7FF01A